MIHEMQRPWFVVGSLFLTLFFVFGAGYNTGGVFVLPLTEQFGWSRAQVSLLQTTLAISAGLLVPLVGWLLDKIDARFVICAGTALGAVGFAVASIADSFAAMLCAYSLLGMGIAAATLLPASVLIPNWFREERGVPMGIVMAGTSVGGTVMTFIASEVIANGGWRPAYVVMAVPMVVAVIPVVAAFVRTRPANAGVPADQDMEAEISGLEIKHALKTSSMWLVAVADLLFTMTISGTNLHLAPFFVDSGYSAAYAAGVLSITLGLAAVGKLVMGYVADKAGVRIALAFNLLLIAVALQILPVVMSSGMSWVFVLLYGLAWGSPLVLVPIVLAEAVGLKRLGSVLGLTGVFTTAGGALGPLIAGRIFDLTGSYTAAFNLFTVGLLVAAVAALLCRRLTA